MGKITDIRPQQRAKSRVNIYVDGEFAAALEALTVKACGLEIGTEISKEKLTELEAESEKESALRRAFAYVSRRMRTEHELYAYLTGKGYGGDTVNSVIENLKSYGYVNDEDFIRSYVANKSGVRGKRRLRHDLGILGAEESTVNAVLEELGDQREAAARAAEKYLRTHSYDYKKLCAHLSAKGFEWEDVRAAVRGLGKEEDDEGSI